MKTGQLIRRLRASNLYAECPCGGEFKLSDAILFDGTKPFPEEALQTQKRFNDELKNREMELQKKKKLATEKAFRNAICPSLRSLKLDPFDVKPILHPIDFVVFKGMSKEETISDVLLLTRKYDCPSINLAREQIKNAVLAKNMIDKWRE